MLNFQDASERKRVSMNIGAQTRKGDVTAEARRQREAREQARRANAAAGKIQAFVRSTWVRSRARAAVRETFVKRAGDLIRIAALLRAQNKTFTPPNNALTIMIREWLFGWHVQSAESEQYRVMLAGFLNPNFATSDWLVVAFASRCLDDARDSTSVAMLTAHSSQAVGAKLCPAATRYAVATNQPALLLQCMLAAESSNDVVSMRAVFTNVKPNSKFDVLGGAIATLPSSTRLFFYEAGVDMPSPPAFMCDLLAHSFSYRRDDVSAASTFIRLLSRVVDGLSPETLAWLAKNHVYDLLSLAPLPAAALLNRICERWTLPLTKSSLSPRSLILLESVRRHASSASAGAEPLAVCALWAALVSSWNAAPSSADDAQWMSACNFACAATSLLMQTLDDEEMFRRQAPFTLPELEEIATVLKSLLFTITWQRDCEATPAIVSFFCDLHARFQRHPDLGLPLDFWHFTQLVRKELGIGQPPRGIAHSRMQVEGEEDSDNDGEVAASRGRMALAEEQLPSQASSRGKRVLRELPMCVPFADRVELFYQFLARHKVDEINEIMDPQNRVQAQVHRDSVVADAFEQLENANFTGRVRITFVSALGLEEAGIDGGGLFKEFVQQFCAEAFRPTRGLFVANAEGKLSPHPKASPRLLKFVGKVLAKAVFDGILVEPELAGWVLNHLSGRRNTLHDYALHDAEAARGLMRLKSLSAEEWASLDLYFTAVSAVTGAEVELVPNGSTLAVTKENFATFAELLANFRLNLELLPLVSALAEGFHTLIGPSWVGCFSPTELQMLIGGSNRDFSIAELRAHTVYTGGYWATDDYIAMFWSVVKDDFSARERGLLLRFVTSCSRPPLSGFGSLFPAFTICKVRNDADRLPTASTCVNLLKLPQYASREILRAKLLTAIESGSGFELS